MRSVAFFFLALFIFFFSCSYAQSLPDAELLRAHNYKDTRFKDREVVYGFGEKKGGGVFYHLLSSGMFAYQKLFSPVLSRSCAFSPSCSGYSKELIKRYGLLRGVVFTSDRLMRCNRVSLSDKKYSYFDSPMHKHIESAEIYNFKYHGK